MRSSFSFTKCNQLLCINPHKLQLESSFVFPERDVNPDPTTALKSSLIDKDEARGIKMSQEGCDPGVNEDLMGWACCTGLEMGKSVTLGGSVAALGPL